MRNTSQRRESILGMLDRQDSVQVTDLVDQLDAVHTVITDAGIGAAYRDGLQKLGIDLLIAA